MKYSLLAQTKREVLATSSKRTEWSWCGFGAGMLGYVLLSTVFGSVPDEDTLRAAWLAIGLVPGFMGFCVGYTLSGLVD
jgi:hypothetical protein